jgi:serine/threonine protein phosphatase PrpC
MQYEFASAENIGDRKEQQDRVAMATHPRHPDAVLAVLADGMGGHKGGALASQAVIDAIMPMFDAFNPDTGSPHDWLAGMVRAAHDRIAKIGRGLNRDPRSTCVLAIAQRHRIDWAHCGDSRLYLFRGSEFVSRTEDHSMVEILVRQGEITEDEALVHPDRSTLFSSLGGPEEPQVAFGTLEKPQPGDTILMASDGLWAYFRNRELALLTEYRGLTEACDRLVALARRRARGHGDNLTVAMVRHAGTAPRKGLLGSLFSNSAAPPKAVTPSPLEDTRRFLLAYLRNTAGQDIATLSELIAACSDPAAMRDIIVSGEPVFARMTSRAKATAFAARALELLE